jgi:hypothetical protein
VQSTVWKTVRTELYRVKQAEIWYRCVAAGVKVNHTARLVEYRWQGAAGPSLAEVAAALLPCTGTFSVRAVAPEQTSFEGGVGWALAND